MSTVLLPIFYLPPTSWFAKFVNPEVDIFLEQFENLPKQTFRNRANIYGANGKLSLIIPLHHNGTRVLKDIEISYAENWQKLHWKSIKTAYQSSPYFEYYEDYLIEMYQFQNRFLLDHNLKCLEVVQKILKTDTKYELTKTYEPIPTGKDYRNSFSAKKDNDGIFEPYYQTFAEKFGFIKNLSIIDVLCNIGPESPTYLKKLN